MLKYHSLAELNDLCLKKDKEMWEIVLQAELDESERTAEESTAKMLEMYQARKSADQLYDGSLRSGSKMAGGDGALLQQYNESGQNLCGDFMGKVMEKAIKMATELVRTGS